VDGLPPAQVGHGAPVAEAERLGRHRALVQVLAEVDGLLRRHLGRLWQGGVRVDDGAVSYDENIRECPGRRRAGRIGGGGEVGDAALGSRGHDARAHMGIHHDAPRLRIPGEPDRTAAGGQTELLPHELLHQRVLHQAGAPDHQSDGQFGAAVLADLEADDAAALVAADGIEVRLGAHADTLAGEQLGGVACQLAVEHGQHGGGDVVDCDVDQGDQVRVDAREVLAHEVVQFGGELDPCGSTADDGEAQQCAALSVRHGRVRRRLEEGQDAQPDAPRVRHVAQEVGVLPHPRDAERLRVGPDGHDEPVVRHRERGAVGCGGGVGPRRVRSRAGVGRRAVGEDEVVVPRVGLHRHCLAGEVDVVGPALVEGDIAQAPHRLQHRAELDRSHAAARQQRREDEVAPRRDQDALELGWVQRAGQGVACPAGAEYHHPFSLLFSLCVYDLAMLVSYGTVVLCGGDSLWESDVGRHGADGTKIRVQRYSNLCQEILTPSRLLLDERGIPPSVSGYCASASVVGKQPP